MRKRSMIHSRHAWQRQPKIVTKPRGNPYLRGVSYFTDFEFDVFAEGVKEAGAMGIMYTEETRK